MSLLPLVGAASNKGLRIDCRGDKSTIHIKTATQLAGIGGEQSEGKYYVLNNDIDLVDEWVSIYNFRGTFDGQGYSINNLYIRTSYRTFGLFGQTNGSAIIKNVGVNIASNGLTASTSGDKLNNRPAYMGGLVGYNHGTVTIENCYVTGDISASGSGYADVGGLIGSSSGKVNIINSYVTGNITATTSHHGSSPSVYAGGLIGFSSGKVNIINSYATGNITAIGSAVAGGLFGGSTYDGSVVVKDCYATNDVTATATFGYETYHWQGVTRENRGVAWAGGLVGSNLGRVSVTNSYAIGDVIATGNSSSNVAAGGLVNGNYGSVTVKGCYRLSSQKIIGNVINKAGNSRTFEGMTNQQSFVGWDFESIWAIESNLNNGYPYLLSVESVVPIVEEGLFVPFWFVALVVVVVVLVVMGVAYVLMKKVLKRLKGVTLILDSRYT